MYAGTLVEFSDVYTLFGKQNHPYTQGLRNAIPIVGEHKDVLESIPGFIPDVLNPPLGCRFYPRCPYVMQTCKTQRPQLLEISRGHWVACNLYD